MTEELARLVRSLSTGELTLFYKDEACLQKLQGVCNNKMACEKISGLPVILPGEAKTRFLMLRRVFRLNKDGMYTDSQLLHYLAGWCQFAPENEEVKLLQGGD